jgi:hypothetical protein
MPGGAPIGALVVLSPWAALVGLAFILPLAALVLRERRDARLRAVLGLLAPTRRLRLLRALGIAVAGLLVAAAAAQPTLRDTGGAQMRSDVELYLAFDVSRSMGATASPGARNRLDRSLALARRLHGGLQDVPTGVATLTTRMLPLLFPIMDGRGVPAVLGGSVALMQPPPTALTTPRASQVGAITLAAHRTYFSRSARRRALVVFSDLDSDEFGLSGTLTTLRRARIEPFVVRVAAPGDRLFASDGRPDAYRSTSTLAVSQLRGAGWHAYEESQLERLARDVQQFLGTGPTRRSGVVESQRPLASVLGLAALAAVAALTLPSLLAGITAGRRLRRRPV